MDFDTPPFSEYWIGSCSSSELRLCRLLGEVMALLDDVMASDADNPLVALAGDIKALGIFGKILQIGGIIEKYY